MSEESLLPWPHGPTHKLDGQGRYFVTSATLHHEHHFRSHDRLQLLHDSLLRYADKFRWNLEAWAVFSNHYHFVARSPEDPCSLRVMLSQLHEFTAKRVNALDTMSGRQVWHNFWDVKLDHQYSYLARLNYTHQNAVRHGLVKVARDYPWCSAAWFEDNVSAPMVKTIYRMKTDRVVVNGECDPVWEG